jgi:hypothetical protein
MNNGLQSYYYTADIGRYIHRIASPHDSLLLEPAGYIPFYAEIYSADEIGLTSEIVLNYRVRYGADWYVHYLKEQHPTFLVERNNILCRRSVDNAQFSPEEWAWFTAHYTQIAHEHYNAENYTHSQLFLRLAKSVISQDLNVFKSNGLP